MSNDSALLEDTLAFMENIEDQWEMTPKSVLVHHPKDPLLHWHDSAKLFQRYGDIVFTLGSTTSVVPDFPSALADPISWHPPHEKIISVELFGSIGR